VALRHYGRPQGPDNLPDVQRAESPRGSWDPATVSEVVAAFGPVAPRWWVAGGYAIELAVGYPLRPHGDIDVLLLRPDQLIVQEALAGWEWWAADPPGTLRPWRAGEVLSAEVHDIWCRPGPTLPWQIQVMLDESDGPDWVSRRSSQVRRRVDRIGTVSADGVPYLVPELQLFYKAQQPRPKDEQDFAAVLPVLEQSQRDWLAYAIARVYGSHPWHARLT
jgi:hypothetical protein